MYTSINTLCTVKRYLRDLLMRIKTLNYDDHFLDFSLVRVICIFVFVLVKNMM